MRINVQLSAFNFISIILKIINNELLFELSLAYKLNDNNNTNILQQLALFTLIYGINSILNLIEHNKKKYITFCELNGWNIIIKCLTHNCSNIMKLYIYFIQVICSQKCKFIQNIF